ncbi:MAG: iron-sulfur cluster assembly accessory protein [Xenococcaceae cyanobacterium MO_167.B27]|nr:iron-sulfur cluster assembly accessory protein [Xenococcaceae cyanobacterium MO_167.B27]
MIHLSKSAAAEITRMKLSRNKPDSLLRLKVQTGGCSGLFYSLELEYLPEDNELSHQKTDLYFEVEGISLVIDNQSYGYLDGTKLDYSEDLMGGGFRFQNPHATKTCGCGLSFEIDQK